MVKTDLGLWLGKLYLGFSIILFIMFFCFYSYLSIKIYNAHQTRGDLTNFTQAMWNTTHGRVMQNTFNYSIHNFWGDREMDIPLSSNIFGIHFNPILFLLVPFYTIFPLPKTLLIAQAFLVSLSGIIVYLLTLNIIKSKFLAIVIQLVFYVYIPVLSAVLSEFHAFTLSIFFMFLVIFFRVYRSIYYYIALFMLLMIQENTAIGGIFFGVYLILSERKIIRGLVTILISLVYFILVIKFLIPGLSNYGIYLFDSIYGNPLGGGISEIIINGIKNPLLLFKTIITESNMEYLGQLALPVIPFIILSPLVLLLSLGTLLPNLLSSSGILKSIHMHYESLFIPFLFFGVILGIKSGIDKVRWNQRNIYLAACTLILFTLSFAQFKFFSDFKLNRQLVFGEIYLEHNKELDNLILSIPENASVATQDFISGHLANRRGLYLFPVNMDKVDYLLLSNNQSTWPLTKDEQMQIIERLVKNSDFHIIYKSNNYILMKNSRVFNF